MLFNSFDYFIFFAVFSGTYFLAPLRWEWMKAFVVLSGFFFYAYPNPPFAFLLLGLIVFGWWTGNLLSDSQPASVRKAIVTFGIVVNLGVLALFKYSAFLIGNLNSVARSIGLHGFAAPPALFLPIGISFLVFENISFLIDRYRKVFREKVGVVDYALYLSFFPHLLSGPIVRAADFVPQLRTRPKVDARDLQVATAFITVGLFLKMVGSDAIFAPVADAVFTSQTSLNAADAWSGALAFSGQIYCDFSGYTLAAIGFARLLGFRLCLNFHSPYAAEGFSDFWQRWHISLSRWLRDYLYIPLGGNRCGETRTHVNLMLTMLLGGIWHGASWQFVLWGFLHGAFLIVEKFLGKGFTALPRFIKKASTFILVTLAWIPFRAPTMDSTLRVWRGVFGSAGVSLGLASVQLWMMAVGMILLLVAQVRTRDVTFEGFWLSLSSYQRGLLLAALWLILLMEPGVSRAFIYFQF